MKRIGILCLALVFAFSLISTNLVFSGEATEEPAQTEEVQKEKAVPSEPEEVKTSEPEPAEPEEGEAKAPEAAEPEKAEE